jgi:vacuolar-type H+-ATPase subunit F/Vma7
VAGSEADGRDFVRSNALLGITGSYPKPQRKLTVQLTKKNAHAKSKKKTEERGLLIIAIKAHMTNATARACHMKSLGEVPLVLPTTKGTNTALIRTTNVRKAAIALSTFIAISYASPTNDVQRLR